MNKIMHPIEPEELMAYLNGELSRDRTAVAAAHVSECAECREIVSELRRVAQALAMWDLGSVDSVIPPTVVAALEENAIAPRRILSARPAWRTFPRRHWQTTAWIGAAAAFAVVVYVGTVILKGRNTDGAFEQVAGIHQAEGTHQQAPVQTYVYIPKSGAKPQSELSASLENQREAGAKGSLSLLPPPPPPSRGGGTSSVPVSGPMIIRTAQLALTTKDFDNARSAMETILKRHRGYVGELKVGGSTGSGRTLTATLRVPADQLDASLTNLKTLGRVESESQSGQDVTSQYVDLQARLANARNTEQRLTDLLRQRTGKLSDVLEVEQEVDRVRGEIEQMEAERKTMSNQVSFATLNATITEDYKAQLQVVPPSTSTRLSNAAVEGYKSMVDGVVGLALFLLEDGPTLLLWGAILFFPARLLWKRARRGFAQ